jgi:hypothetical protein
MYKTSIREVKKKSTGVYRENSPAYNFILVSIASNLGSDIGYTVLGFC